jgi:hypothetical protein
MDEHIKQRQALEVQKESLQAEQLQLQKEIEDGNKALDIINMNKKTVEESFVMVKEEMSKCGIDSTSSVRFLNVINAFKKYGYDANKIMGAFADTIEVKERLKQETDDNQRSRYHT